ncbi:MAG: GLUG motif-containing protein, partial [Planctomycetota bacterium]
MVKIRVFGQKLARKHSCWYLCVLTRNRGRRFEGVLSLFVALCLLSSPAQGKKYGGGSGTAEEPYLINTAQQMNTIGTRPTDWDKHFKLTADIDLSGYPGTAFNIIGNGTIQFRGVFDGDGHTISNFTYNWTGAFTTNIALFGWVDGNDVEIKNLGLIEPNVVMANGIRAGALIGWQNSGTVSNCYVEGGSVSGDSQIGGLMGGNGGTVIDCYATCTVTAYNWAGGLAGINADGGVITNCSASGPV